MASRRRTQQEMCRKEYRTYCECHPFRITYFPFMPSVSIEWYNDCKSCCQCFISLTTKSEESFSRKMNLSSLFFHLSIKNRCAVFNFELFSYNRGINKPCIELFDNFITSGMEIVFLVLIWSNLSLPPYSMTKTEISSLFNGDIKELISNRCSSIILALKGIFPAQQPF